VADQAPDACVLGADTLVSVAGKVMVKPQDDSDARRMLRELSGTRQEVITGVGMICPDNTRLISSETTRVTMREISEAEIDAYIASGEWKDKAGAYAIQDTADQFVTLVEGSFTNVVGLPMELVERMLRELHERPDAHRIN